MDSPSASRIIERFRAPALDLASSFGFGNSTPISARLPCLRRLLLQHPGGADTWAAASAVRAARLPIQLTRVTPDDTHWYTRELRAGLCMPVGTPEFVRGYMRAAGIAQPPWTCYPRELARHMLQQPRRVMAGAALAASKPIFVKPVSDRSFRGFVLRSDRGDMDAQANAQLDRLLQLPRTDPVWVAKALEIVSEWRYYVLYGEVIGYVRFFPLADGDLPAPDIDDISAVIAAIPHDAAYAIDFAVLQSDQTTVTSVHDAWGLELIPFGPDRPADMDFLRLLWTRWSRLMRRALDPEGGAASRRRTPEAAQDDRRTPV